MLALESENYKRNLNLMSEIIGITLDYNPDVTHANIF